MATDHIRYDVLARDALRGVLRRVLTDAAEQGLPGDHHFFITFVSTADGVKLSPRLLAQYPEEMTVILQHQFWDLVVTEDRFEVGLSFGGFPNASWSPSARSRASSIPRYSSACNSKPRMLRPTPKARQRRCLQRPPCAQRRRQRQRPASRPNPPRVPKSSGSIVSARNRFAGGAPA